MNPQMETPPLAGGGAKENQATVESNLAANCAQNLSSAQPCGDEITLLRTTGNMLVSKRWNADGTVEGETSAFNFSHRAVRVVDLRSLSALLTSIETDPRTCLIRGRYVGDEVAVPLMRLEENWRPGLVLRRKEHFKDRALHALMIDVDGFAPTVGDPLIDTEACITEYVRANLPTCFFEVSYHWQLSGKAGRPENAGVLKVHIWFWLKTAYSCADLTAWHAHEGFGSNVDRALFQEVQVHYTASPVFAPGVANPVTRRSGFFDGAFGDEVGLCISAKALAAGALAAASGTSAAQETRKAIDGDPVAQALYDRGLVKSERRDGALNITCPCAGEHSSESGDTSTVYYPPNTGGFSYGNFACRHAHCVERAQRDFRKALGIAPHSPPAPSATGFDDMPTEGCDAPTPPTSLAAFESILSLGKYMLRSTNETWPGASVNRSVSPWPKGAKKVKHTDPDTGEITFKWEDGEMPPSQWLDKHRPVHQIGWMPGQPQIVEGKVLQESGATDAPGHRMYNLYKPPPVLPGDASLAIPWIDLVHGVYPEHAKHIIRWFAHYAQRPHVKVNHGLVLGGPPGIGKDTMLEPIKRGCVGAWNWADISPGAALGRFNGWAKNIIVRVSEMRDTDNRYTLYESLKTYLAAPPDSILVDEKNLREHYVVNVMGMIFTTNNRTDGLYLPADDRRHYVAWSERVKESFTEGYWKSIYDWYDSGGIGHVAAYLRSLDLSNFDPKAPPELTRDFWLIVQSGEPPENAEFRDLVDGLEHKDAFTLGDLVEVADRLNMHQVSGDLRERRNRRTFNHKFAAIGYGAVRNPDAKEGQWVVHGKRQTIYCRLDKSLADQVRHCRDLQVRAAKPVVDPFADQ